MMNGLRWTARCALAGAMLLTGCAGGGGDGDTQGGGGNDAGKSAWTTLGTRSTDSGANVPLTQDATAQWRDYDPPALYPRSVSDNSQYITMDDGIRLGASVVWPADEAGERITQPLPVILTLTGYSKDNAAFAQMPTIGGPNAYLVSHGYIHVNVDVRGTGRSDGQWMGFDAREQQDYRQVVDWVVAQPWSDGRIGMYGTSFLGITSVLTAAKGHPAVKAAYSIAAPLSDAYRDLPVVGGQGSFGFLSIWMSFVGAMGMVNASALQDPAQFLSATTQHLTSYLSVFQLPTLLRALQGDPEVVYDTDFWGIRSPVEQAANLQVPVFIVSGLQDAFQRGAPRFYDALKDHTTAKLLMGPWNHVEASSGGTSLVVGSTSSRASLPVDDIPVLDHSALLWFDQYVKGEALGAETLPNVTHWVWGHDHFVTDSDWPNPQARAQRHYLQPAGGLAPQAPAGDGAPATVLQQPLNGICSQSASQVSLGILGLTQLPCFSDDTVVQALEAKYDSAPMGEDFYLDGPIQADLWISSTLSNAGLAVRVSDVAPNGSAFNLSNGLLTVSLRAVDPAKSRYLDGQMIQPWHPFTQASLQPLTPGEPTLVAVEVFPTSALIKKGHKLRISVGASNFPFGLPPLPDLLATTGGVLSVYNDAAHPSSVVLPVVPVSALQ